MRISKIVLLVTGIIVLMVAGLWRPVVAPQLTKLPTSLDIKYQFTGTYTGSVNPSTGRYPSTGRSRRCRRRAPRPSWWSTTPRPW